MVNDGHVINLIVTQSLWHYIGTMRVPGYQNIIWWSSQFF